MKRFALLVLALFCFAGAAGAARFYDRTTFLGDVTVGTWNAISNLSAAVSYSALGTYTNRTYTNAYRIAGSNILGRIPFSTNVTVTWTGATNMSNCVTLGWSVYGGLSAYVIERSYDGGSTWTNWTRVAPGDTSWTDYGTNSWSTNVWTNSIALMPAPATPWTSPTATPTRVEWRAQNGAVSNTIGGLQAQVGTNAQDISEFRGAVTNDLLWITNRTAALQEDLTRAVAGLTTNEADVARIEANLALNALRDLAANDLIWAPYEDMVVDAFRDQTGVLAANTSNMTYDSSGYYETVLLVTPSSVDSNHLVLHYKLNDANKNGPGNITDSTTNGISGNGLLNVSPLDNPGHHGYCVTFDGATEDIIIPDNSKLSFGDGSSDKPFSISVWVKWSGSGNMNVFFRGASTAREYDLTIVSGVPYLTLADDDSTHYEYWDGGSVPANVWALVTCTYNGTPGSGTSGNIYVNGIVQSTSHGSSGYTAMHNQAEDCGIMMGWHDSPNYTAGSLDDLRIYSDVLSSNEVYTLYTGDEENICTGGGGGDGVITSTNWMANFTPSIAKASLLVEPVDALDMSTDLVLQVSRNLGTNWTRIALTRSVSFSNTVEVWEGSTNAFAGTPCSNMQMRVRSYNNKTTRVRGWSFLWK